MSLNIIYNWVVKELASRIIAGAGFAYGNSNEMPFIKQFFNGGTIVLGLFVPDRLVQGVMMVHQLNSFLADQSGDLKLEFSTEYRAKIYDIVKGPYLSMPETSGLKDNPDKPERSSQNFLQESVGGCGIAF
jgi:outer membrane protein assembly factor BamA